MFEVFLKHCIYEKCINLIFDGIFKAFKKPDREYEILSVEPQKTENGSVVSELYTVKYKGKIYRFSWASKKFLMDIFVKYHGHSNEKAEREFYEMLEEEIRKQPGRKKELKRLQELWDDMPDTTIKEDWNIPTVTIKRTADGTIIREWVENDKNIP